jgi:glycosyltransferase involved in cell wall biosynthesis
MVLQHETRHSQDFIVKKPRILFIANVDWFFLSHRLSIARAARDSGAEVIIAAGETDKSAVMLGEGFRFLPLPISRKGTNPFAEIRALKSIIAAYRKTQPDIVHHVTIKPIIYGSLAARLVRHRAVINAVSGLGYSFSPQGQMQVMRPLIKSLYRFVLRNRGSCTVFQNPDDLEDFVSMGLVQREQTVIIRGSGVDCSIFHPSPEPEGTPVIVLAGRMLWDKGVGEFVDAARLIRADRPDVRFVLVGDRDTENRAAIPQQQMDTWVSEGVVECWGRRSDMPDILRSAHMVALPSLHREGLPKILLEAAACGRPIVATDVPGCREIARHEVNGLLVPPHDARALAAAICRLLDTPQLRSEYGKAGREIVEREFSQQIVVAQTLALYRKMLGEQWPQTVKAH